MVASMADLLPGRRVKNHLLSTEDKVDCFFFSSLSLYFS